MQRQLHKSLVAEETFNRQVTTDLLAAIGFAVILTALALMQAVPIVILMTAFLIAVVVVIVRVFGHRQALLRALNSSTK